MEQSSAESLPDWSNVYGDIPVTKACSDSTPSGNPLLMVDAGRKESHSVNIDKPICAYTIWPNMLSHSLSQNILEFEKEKVKRSILVFKIS